MSTRSLLLVLGTTAVSLVAASAAPTEGQRVDGGLGELLPYTPRQDKAGRGPVSQPAGRGAPDQAGQGPMGRGAQQGARR
jgi:hypothetical protein